MDNPKKPLKKYFRVSTLFIVIGFITCFIRPLWMLSIPLIIIGIVIQMKNIQKPDKTNKVDHADTSGTLTISKQSNMDVEIVKPNSTLKTNSIPKTTNSIQEHINQGKVPIHSFRLDGTPIYWQEDGVKYYAPTKKRVYKVKKIGKRERIGQSQTVQSWSRIGKGKLQITPDGFTFMSEIGMEQFNFTQIADIDMSSHPSGIRMYMKNGKAVVFNFNNADEMFAAINFYKQVAPTWQLVKETTGAMLVQRFNRSL